MLHRKMLTDALQNNKQFSNYTNYNELIKNQLQLQ